MTGTKRISAAVLMALREALSVVFWYRNDLKRFLRDCLEDSSILLHLDWSANKRDIVAELVDRLMKNEAANQPALLRLMIEVSHMTDFSHLARIEGGPDKVKKAKHAVQALRTQIKGLEELLRDQDEIQKKRAEHAAAQKKIGGVLDELEKLKAEYFALLTGSNPQQRGFKLEKILRSLFEIYDLDPRASFKIVGEQIDGAFSFDNTEFILEAKWQKDPVDSSDLDRLQAKVERKLENTLGLYTSINGYSKEGLEAFRGARPHLFLMDGADLMAVLENRIDLPTLLKRKKKEASQTGNIYLKVADIL